jgi:hypothetical protein
VALSKNGHPLVKKLSDTRWSAHASALAALSEGYAEIQEVCSQMANSDTLQPVSRCEAQGLVKSLSSVETGILTCLWQEILQRFNKTSICLQSPSMELQTGISLLISLQEFVLSLRDKFEKFENAGKELSRTNNYKSDTKRKTKRKRMWESGDAESTVFQSASEQFRVNVFLVIIDQLSTALKKRVSAYTAASNRFAFLEKITESTEEEVRKGALCLQSFYPHDLEASSIENEFVQFAAYIKNHNLSRADCLIGQTLYAILLEDEVSSAFPNMEVALRIYLSLMCTNCSGERSFSKLGRVKGILRSTMSQERLNSLSLLSIEHDLLRSVDVDTIIEKFANSKARRATL